MKKFWSTLLAFVLVVGIACPTLYAQDAAPEMEETVATTPTGLSTGAAEGLVTPIPRNTEGAPNEASVPANAPVSGGWSHSIGQLIEVVLPSLEVLLAAIAAFILARFYKWTGLKKNAEINKFLISLSKQGINYANSWARKLGSEQPGEKKMQVAVNYITGRMKANNIPAMAADKLAELIEQQYQRNKDAANA